MLEVYEQSYLIFAANGEAAKYGEIPREIYYASLTKLRVWTKLAMQKTSTADLWEISWCP